MATPRTILLFKQLEPVLPSGRERWWLAEVFLTSDGPRTRLVGGFNSEAEARADMERRQAIINPKG